MLKHFYEKVLPTRGTYCATGIAKSGKVINIFEEDLDGLISTVKRLDAEGYNVFAALSSFDGHSRRADNAMFCKSFFIDLDVGEGGKKYPDRDSALQALYSFLGEAELPPPVIVDSGGGYHAYWILDRDVPSVEWKPYAQKFKDFCLARGLKIDPAVTADAARILRAPYTANRKLDEPRATQILEGPIVEYDFDIFKDFLGVIQTSQTTLDILASLPKGFDKEVFDPAKFDSFEYVFADIVEKSLQDDGCGQIKYILINSRTVEEPLWRAGLSVAMRCVDADPSIYLMSEDYPNYDRDETLYKARQTLNANWAYSCEKFEGLNPAGCQGCARKGHIPSPTHIGRRLRQPEPVPVEEDASPESTSFLLNIFKKEEMFPFMRGPKGGIFFQPAPKVDKGGKVTDQDIIQITQHDVFPFKRMFSTADGECLMMRLLLPHDPDREFILPMKHVIATDKFKEVMMSNGVMFEPEVAPLLMKYVIKWGKYLVNADSAEQMRMQMGWTEDCKGFVIGNNEVTYTGEIVKTASSPLVRSIAKLLHPEGSYKKWQEAANLLNTPSLEHSAFGLLLGFGSPLMRLTSTPGAAVCFTGGTGSGKTGTLYAALSIYGHPHDLSVLDKGATANGFTGRYLNLKNIPLGLDEVSNASPEHLSHLIHQISQGKTKIRMQSSVNAERELEQSASLILIMTSNTDITDLLQNLKSSPDGEMARYIQFMLNRPAFLQTNPEYGKRIYDTFNHHYGHAGPVFIKKFYEVGEDYVLGLINKWDQKFEWLFGSDIGYRFHRNMLSASFAAGELAMEAGIISFDLERIFKKIVNDMIDMRSKVKLNSTDFGSVLSEFINAHHSGFLTVNDNRVVVEPRAALIGRNEIHSQTRYVSKTALRKYLSELSISTQQFESTLKNDGLITYSGKKRLGTSWASGADIGPVAVYGFHYTIPEEYLDQSSA